MKKIALLSLCVLVFNSCNKKELLSKNALLPGEEYYSYGTVSICNDEKVANFETMLPVLKYGTYQYYKFYNISTKNDYAVLAVLEILGAEDTDLRRYDSTAKRKKTKVKPGSVLLDDLPSLSGSKDFSNLKDGDTITFICFHDDRFDETNINDTILKFYQTNLPKILEYEDPNKREPKKGNGGVLTVTECLK